MSEKRLPEGKYYIGDPCYVINSGKWSEFCDVYWDTPNGGIFDFDGFSVCAFNTQWGDGCYPASNGAMLSVDAGLIGAIPLALCLGGDRSEGTVVEFARSFLCHRDTNGLLHFGDFTVMTGDEDDEDGCCPECGR